MSEGLRNPPTKCLHWFRFVLAFLLMPFVLPIALATLAVLTLIAVVALPFGYVFPEGHLHFYDFPDATPRQRELIAKWRARYRELTVWQRIKRARLKSRRRRHTSHRRESALLRNWNAKYPPAHPLPKV